MWLTNLKIWDGESSDLSEFDAIEIIAGKITSLGVTADIDITPSRDMAGLTVIPGLIHKTLGSQASNENLLADQTGFTTA